MSFWKDPTECQGLRAALLRFLFGSNAFLFVCASAPFGMLTCLSGGLPVGMCSSYIHQKLEVAAESRTSVAFWLCLFFTLRAHLAATLLTALACSWLQSKYVILLLVVD